MNQRALTGTYECGNGARTDTFKSPGSVAVCAKHHARLSCYKLSPEPKTALSLGLQTPASRYRKGLRNRLWPPAIVMSSAYMQYVNNYCTAASCLFSIAFAVCLTIVSLQHDEGRLPLRVFVVCLCVIFQKIETLGHEICRKRARVKVDLKGSRSSEVLTPATRF